MMPMSWTLAPTAPRTGFQPPPMLRAVPMPWKVCHTGLRSVVTTWSASSALLASLRIFSEPERISWMMVPLAL